MDKIYIPKSSVKQVSFKNGGHLLRFSVHAETLVKFLLDQIESGEFVSDKGWLSINIAERRTASEWGFDGPGPAFTALEMGRGGEPTACGQDVRWVDQGPSSIN